ncbi:hypothetical protein C5167_017813 [Papaver somniferum]|uniref:Uncharacterized protein n=1 Tax=Papaver somniferum TaxID=3469 RepID=A0A4Y7IKH4_PAPSO|nr:hypothetical protein C5167_017813 [Papaver somniferum]
MEEGNTVDVIEHVAGVLAGLLKGGMSNWSVNSVVKHFWKPSLFQKKERKRFESQVQNSDMKNPPLPALSGANYHASPADLRRPSLASADVDPSAAPHPK